MMITFTGLAIPLKSSKLAIITNYSRRRAPVAIAKSDFMAKCDRGSDARPEQNWQARYLHDKTVVKFNAGSKFTGRWLANSTLRKITY